MKTKNRNMKRVCIVHLSISTILNFTNGSKHTLNYGYLSLLDDLHLQDDLIHKHRDPGARQGMILKLWHRNHYEKLQKLFC